MADILIKGLEMPKKGNIGLLLYSDGSVEICGTGSLSKPLYGVPVKKADALPPHGRLIDADKLIQYLLTIKPRNETIGTCVKCEIKDLENAPTILEASK